METIKLYMSSDMQYQWKHLEKLLSRDNTGMPYGVVKHVKRWPKTVPVAIFTVMMLNIF